LPTAVGAGINHHSELDVDLYEMASIYTDTMASSETELKELLELGITIEEVGHVINGTKSAERGRITVFQSLGKVTFSILNHAQNYSYAKTNLKW
jgi:thiomorpholine-carboxylate dehydrogenase